MLSEVEASLTFRIEDAIDLKRDSSTPLGCAQNDKEIETADDLIGGVTLMFWSRARN